MLRRKISSATAAKWMSISKHSFVPMVPGTNVILIISISYFRILVTQKCRVEEEQKSEELEDFDSKPIPGVAASLNIQPQGLGGMIDDPQAYSRLRELQLREASHQTDVSRLLAAGRPDLASQVAMGGVGAQNAMLFSGMQGMPFRGDVSSIQQQQQGGGGTGDATSNRSNADLSQQLGISGPQLLQYLQEDAFRRQLERERQIQFELLLRQQQQLPGSGMSNDQAMMMMMQQQQQQRGAAGLNPSGSLGGMPNQQLQFLMMQQQLQQQQLQQQLGQGSIQQQQQLHGDLMKANDETEAGAEGSEQHLAHPQESEEQNGEDHSPSGSEDYEYAEDI